MAGLHHRDYLDGVPLFDGLSRRQRRKLSRGAVKVEVDAGQTLFDEGSEGHELVVLLSGSVDVLRDGVHIATLGPGTSVGESALLTREHRNASVVARTDTEIVCLGQDDVDALASRSPQFRHGLEELHAARAPQPAGPAAS
jgi:CRP-like cAMP-binding protein